MSLADATAIDVAASRPYRVHVGTRLLEEAGAALASTVPGARRVVVVTDSNVGPLYYPIVEESLRSAGLACDVFTFEAGEQSKNIHTYAAMLEFLAERELDRGDAVVALGGGVTGDMAGFAAATYLRGIAYLQIPTTLLAMVDSSVGGKCAIDLEAGKNLAGAFWQPCAVLADVGCLGTLSPAQVADGCGEVIKHSVIASPELFSLLGERPLTYDAIVEDLGYAARVVASNVMIKSRVVASDEREAGARKLLNFGHSIGHAIEARSGYVLGHGTCVAMGMVAIARGALKVGMPIEDVSAAIEGLCHAHGLETACPYPAGELVSAARHDKKRSGDAIDLVIPHRIGALSIETVGLDLFWDIIAAGVEPAEGVVAP